MNDIAKLFSDIGEPLAAGLFEDPTASVARRFCRGYRRMYEECTLAEYDPSSCLYPYGTPMKEGAAIQLAYCRQYWIDTDILKEKSPDAERIFLEFDRVQNSFVTGEDRQEVRKYACGNIEAWNHSALDFDRITAEGLTGYEKRILEMKDEDLKAALFDLLKGIRTYLCRSVEYLESVNADEKLINALKKVPENPSDTAYEALVSANFMMCLDSCDNLGYVDGWLPRYWKGEDLSKELRDIALNIFRGGWSLTVGPEYSELTKQWIKACQGLPRPMVELRVTPDMPDDLWELALDSIFAGYSQPSFYNDTAILRRLRERIPHAPEEDINKFAGMGCTETSLSGMTFSGGIDVNLSVLGVFDRCMREELSEHESFESFYEAFFKRLHRAQDAVINSINNYYKKRAEIAFAPLRTLFTRGCIENEKGYLQGGAKYTYAMPCDSGIPNTVDSLLVLKKLVYEDKLYTPSEFIAALDGEDERFRALAAKCPHYGVADPEADRLLSGLTDRFYAYYRKAEFSLGIGFMPTSHQFVRHIGVGRAIGATPDGRHSGEPVADSIAALNGKAVEGPTSMLLSAACFDQEMIYGIPILNLNINNTFSRSSLRALIETYFKMNGTQMQITCQSRETLIAAKKDPEKYRDIIVRVGGFSDYFCNLDPALQDAVIARTNFTE